MSTRDIIEKHRICVEHGGECQDNNCPLQSRRDCIVDTWRDLRDETCAELALMEDVCAATTRWRHANEIGLGVRGAAEVLLAADAALAAYRKESGDD